MSWVTRFEPCVQPRAAGPRAVTALSFGNLLLRWLLIQAVSERAAPVAHGAAGPRLALLKELSQKLLALS